MQTAYAEATALLKASNAAGAFALADDSTAPRLRGSAST